MPIISVIIVTYNSGDILWDCLRHLRTTALPIEVVLVDNASDPEFVQQIRARASDARLILNTENRGFASANNQGLAIAQGAYLLLLNPDALVAPNTLEELTRCLESNSQAGIAGARTYDNQNKTALTAYPSMRAALILWQYLGLARIFPFIYYGYYRQQIEKAKRPFAVGWVGGHCLMMRREVYMQTGGLDPKLFLFMEEPDLCERAAEHGWNTYFVPQATVIHQESTTISRYPLVKMRHYHISPLHYFRKRGQKNAVRLLKIGFIVEIIVKWLVRLVQSSFMRDTAQKARLAAYPVVLNEVWRY